MKEGQGGQIRSLNPAGISRKERHINKQPKPDTTRRKPWVVLGTLTAIAVLVGMMLMVSPQGFKMTHEEIGTGKPALVFIYDPNLDVSIRQPEQMNIARNQLGQQAFFLIAKIGTPQGNKLIAEHNARPPELLLFDPAGQLISRQFALIEADQLIAWLSSATPGLSPGAD
ncbi:MAG: hypothetical protein ACFHXK_19390 [bacterium]